MEVYWTPSYLRVRDKNKGKVCVVTDCDRPAYCKLMCRLHYTRMHRNGVLTARKYTKKVRA